jgi:hypothetical protein
VGGVESPNGHICGNVICGANYRFRHINLSSTTRTPTTIKSGICDPLGHGRHEPGHLQQLHPDIWTKVVSIRQRVRNSNEDESCHWRRRSLGEPDPNCRGYRMDYVNRLETSSVGKWCQYKLAGKFAISALSKAVIGGRSLGVRETTHGQSARMNAKTDRP